MDGVELGELGFDLASPCDRKGVSAYERRPGRDAGAPVEMDRGIGARRHQPHLGGGVIVVILRIKAGAGLGLCRQDADSEEQRGMNNAKCVRS